MQHRSIATWSFIFLLAPFCWANLTEAKPARCFTSDEGSFSCKFHATARDGSFKISAPGKPTYILNMIEPGVASGFVNVGTRNIPLPGRYLRSSTKPACWVNDSTGAKICAR
jgi:hypothetical protein